MASQLMTHLVDASDVEVEILFDARIVEMIARDDNTLVRYRLRFQRCESVEINYADEDNFSPYDLTEGVREGEAVLSGARRFSIRFADGSVMSITCREFEMLPIEG